MSSDQGVTPPKTISRQETNNLQNGSGNYQYNASSITINEVKEQDDRALSTWLSQADPCSDHAAALYQHETGTGEWLLKHERYKQWKYGEGHLWLYGKAGCGKTILCSTVIEDLRTHCQDDTSLVIFYFSFSNDKKQSYEHLLRSIVAQLCHMEPVRSMLRQAYDVPERKIPTIGEMESILRSVADAVYVTIDAMDECPKENRRLVLQGLERLVQEQSQLKFFVTSRELDDIRLSMDAQQFSQISIDDSVVDDDIHTYLSAILARDRRLQRLPEDTKSLIKTKIAARAQGMFRYVYLQLLEIQNLDSYRPSKIRAALDTLPAGLDGTYARILANISDNVRDDAFTLLQWLAYAQAPLTLDELVDTVIIDQNTVHLDDRGELEDALNILSGLVTVGRAWTTERTFQPPESTEVSDYRERAFRPVQLAHFTVKEYLESNRLPKSLQLYHLEAAQGHRLLTRSCLTYLKYYSENAKFSNEEDIETYPLLIYSATSWYFHSSQHGGDVSVEVSFLKAKEVLLDWIKVGDPDRPRRPFFGYKSDDRIGPALYYACHLGLITVAARLIHEGEDVNADGGIWTSALAAASFRGHVDIVSMLLDNGADVDKDGGYEGRALQLAASRGHMEVVGRLLDAAADIDGNDKAHGTALQHAAQSGQINIVKLLIKRGADVQAESGSTYESNALIAASSIGHTEIVKLLLGSGSDVNEGAGRYRTALQRASNSGHAECVEVLLQHGADIDAKTPQRDDTALEAASRRGHLEVVKLLLKYGAMVNESSSGTSGALYLASVFGTADVVKELLDAGAVMKSDWMSMVLAHGSVETVKALLSTGVIVKPELLHITSYADKYHEALKLLGQDSVGK